MYIFRNSSEIIGVIVLFFTVSHSEDIIKSDCVTGECGNVEPELCDYRAYDSANCFDFEQTIKTEQDRQLVLDKLNSRRNKVAAGELRSLTSAADMMKLEWSKELESNAQRWANQCVKHTVPETMDTCRHKGSSQVGQNIATIYGDSPGLTPQALVDVWYMELLNSNSSVIERYQPSSKTGYNHYDYFTQLVWAETTKVGCGGVKFKERVRSSTRVQNRTVYKLVCNFSPTGNQLNQTVYTNGLPCTRCPLKDRCNLKYKALCDSQNPIEKTTQGIPDKYIELNNFNRSLNLKPLSIKDKIKEMLMKSTTKQSSNSTVLTTTEHNDDDVYTPFDFISHLNELTRKTIATTKLRASCKDVLAVDEFIELLKKRLISNDFMFKELFSTTKPSTNATEANFSDSNVEAFMSRIHRNKATPTTHKTTESEYLNSTLLANLVEAIIFRSDGMVPLTKQMEISYSTAAIVNPVKIQAELAPVRVNKEFTGHYFFPEDEDDDEEETDFETSEAYYDATNNIPASDIASEIDDLKRNHATKDFLDDILESEVVTENTIVAVSISPDYLKLYNNGHSNMKKFLEGIAEKSLTDISKSLNPNFTKITHLVTNKRRKKRRLDDWYYYKKVKKPQKKSKERRDPDTNNNEVKYIKLLRQLALDLKMLNLNEKYHCSHNNCASSYYSMLILYYIIFLINVFLK